MRFEWDKNKNDLNITKHGISFRYATRVFDDPYMIDEYDEKHSGINKYGEREDRYYALGYIDHVLYVVYTVHEDKDEEIIRLISARPAEPPEIKAYFINRGAY